MRSNSPSLSAVTALMLVSLVSGCGSSGYTSGTPTPVPSPDAPAPLPSIPPVAAPAVAGDFGRCYSGNPALQTVPNRYEIDSIVRKNIGTGFIYKSKYQPKGTGTFKDNTYVLTHIESKEASAVFATSTEQYTGQEATVSKSIRAAEVSTFLQAQGTTKLTVSYSPAFSYPLDLAQGASFSQTYIVSSETTSTVTPAPPDVSRTTKMTYVGNETVNLGTVEAPVNVVGCKTEISTVENGVTSASTEWIVLSPETFRGLFLMSRDSTTLTQAVNFTFIKVTPASGSTPAVEVTTKLKE